MGFLVWKKYHLATLHGMLAHASNQAYQFNFRHPPRNEVNNKHCPSPFSPILWINIILGISDTPILTDQVFGRNCADESGHTGRGPMLWFFNYLPRKIGVFDKKTELNYIFKKWS
jgi:hypothetical protein